MSSVLVTGGSGLIGRRVLKALTSAEWEVHAVARRSQMPTSTSVEWHTADLLEPSSNVVKRVRPDVLVHLAWEVEPGAFWTSAENLRWVEASIELLRQFVASGGRRVVIAGSCAEYDWKMADRGPLHETETAINPATLYGTAKHDLHRRSSDLLAKSGVELAWGRVFFLYAPDEAPQRLFGSVARSLLSGEPALTSPGAQVRDFLHVDDVAAAFAALASSAVTGPVNIGSGEGIAVRDLVREIGRATGRPELLRIGALPAPQGEPARIVADTHLLRDEVGLLPRWTLRAGIAAAVGDLAASVTSES